MGVFESIYQTALMWKRQLYSKTDHPYLDGTVITRIIHGPDKKWFWYQAKGTKNKTGWGCVYANKSIKPATFYVTDGVVRAKKHLAVKAKKQVLDNGMTLLEEGPDYKIIRQEENGRNKKYIIPERSVGTVLYEPIDLPALCRQSGRPTHGIGSIYDETGRNRLNAMYYSCSQYGLIRPKSHIPASIINDIEAKKAATLV